MDRTGMRMLSESPDRFKVFFACPISVYLDPATHRLEPRYERYIRTLYEGVMTVADEVFLALEREGWGRAIMLTTVCTPLDFAEMRRCDMVVAIPGTSTGVGVELGWASALGKTIVLVLDEGVGYSPMIEGLATVTGNVRELRVPGTFGDAEATALRATLVQVVADAKTRWEQAAGTALAGAGLAVADVVEAGFAGAAAQGGGLMAAFPGGSAAADPAKAAPPTAAAAWANPTEDLAGAMEAAADREDGSAAYASPRFHNHGMLGTWLIGAEEAAEAVEVIDSQSLFRYYGPRMLRKAVAFEGEVASFLGAGHALTLNSGTSALRAALSALRLRPGDEVIVPACTFVATSNAVVLAGGIPVFAEIDDSLGLDPDALAECITPRTVGVMPVHLQGVAARVDAIAAEARRHGLWVLEDAAQAFGATFRGRAVGTFGDAGVFSLQAHKTITCGEGGLLVTDDEGLLRAACRFHDQGGVRVDDGYPSWDDEDAGFGENLKMTELSAGVALAQLRKVGELRRRMRDLHARVRDAVDLRGRMARAEPDSDGALPYAFLFFAHDPADRDAILARLEAEGVPADALYDKPPYALRPYVRWAGGEPVAGLPAFGVRPAFRPLPRSEALMRRIVRMPLSPAFGDAEVACLAAALDRALSPIPAHS
jgi:8-amino-3,8-dideoxy-alpha-D-manno-octulosonate transaminase